MCERGVQLSNPFYSIWSKESEAKIAVSVFLFTSINKLLEPLGSDHIYIIFLTKEASDFVMLAFSEYFVGNNFNLCILHSKETRENVIFYVFVVGLI